jgi:UDP-N-acetylmuramyl tripeptide synthase
VLNREDSRLAALPEREKLLATVRWFGLAPRLKGEFPEDDALYDEELGGGEDGFSSDGGTGDGGTGDGATLLTDFSDDTATIELDGSVYEARLALKGIYNAFNATAALELVQAIVPDTPPALLVDALARVHSAFGRGESLEVDGQPLELVLVKNPGGFRLALRSYDPANCATMIAINDDYADGRDMSWLFDVGFSSLDTEGVAVVSGTRAWDMALRLSYDEVCVGTVERELPAALELLCAKGAGRPKRIYCTYTAMLALRKLLATKTEVERIR